jgi:hypothetical protein
MIVFPAYVMAEIHDVIISDFSFNPGSLTVAAGDTVRWTNQDAIAHTSTSDNGLWNSGPLAQSESFMRAFTAPGTYPYHCILHPFMTGTINVGAQSPVDEDPLTPGQFRLEPNFPNPFNAATNINFELGGEGHALLEIYDTVGRKLETLVDGRLSAGRHSVAWDAGHRPSGIYFYRLAFEGQAQMGRMTLLK